VLIRPEGEGPVVAIGQASHAWISGQLARAWGNERFGEVTPWEEVCLGAEQHDIGWALWDTQPSLNPDTGLPHTFMDSPLDTKLELWSKAPTRMLAQSRYAAMLVSMHATALYGRGLPDDPSEAELQRRFLDEQREFQERMIETLEADRELVRRNQRLVWTWDYLSLALCLGWAPTALDDVPAADGATRLELSENGELDPWPFSAERLSVRAEGRRLSGRFEHEAALHAALAAAPWVTLEFELRPRG
jgi:hypothetical protein